MALFPHERLMLITPGPTVQGEGHRPLVLAPTLPQGRRERKLATAPQGPPLQGSVWGQAAG